MTTEEKRKALKLFCDAHDMCENCPLLIPELKCGRGEQFNFIRKEERVSDSDVNLAYSIAFSEAEKEQPHIKDSGSRREFETGAVRDIQEGKGRCDLLPLGVIADHIQDSVLLFIHHFTRSGNAGDLFRVLDECPAMLGFLDVPTVYLEVAKHFEEGAKKYGEYNWQKGIPTHCYIDSAVRHYLKWLRGDKDEPHDRAFVWNILCCIWTCQNKMELNDYGKDGESDGGSST